MFVNSLFGRDMHTFSAKVSAKCAEVHKGLHSKIADTEMNLRSMMRTGIENSSDASIGSTQVSHAL